MNASCHTARTKNLQDIDTHPRRNAELKAYFLQLAEEHASAINDQVLAERIRLFEAAMDDPLKLWRGELAPLPLARDFGPGERESYTFLDHLVAEGDVQTVVGFLNRSIVRCRIQALRQKRVTGDMGEFMRLASQLCPDLAEHETIALAGQLWSAEYIALENFDSGLIASPPSVSIAPQSIARFDAFPPISGVPARWSVPITIDELFSQWERETKPSASTLSTWSGHKKHFKRFFGAKADDLGSITDTDMVAWKNQLVRENKSTATISRSFFGFARALFRFAVANRLLGSDPSDGIRVSGKTKAGTKMLAYSSQEIAELWVCSTTAGVAWKKWLPRLIIATGSRIGEMAQLHGDHITVEDGIAVIRIAAAQDGGSIKNVGSERTVPIHKTLIEHGFLEFVKQRGSGPLFYERTSGNPKRKHASKAVTNRLAKWIRDLGFSDPRKAPNHAVRHWFKTECAKLNIEDSVADAIQGHNDRSAANTYRHISTEIMQVAINSIALPPANPRSADCVSVLKVARSAKHGLKRKSSELSE